MHRVVLSAPLFLAVVFVAIGVVAANAGFDERNTFRDVGTSSAADLADKILFDPSRFAAARCLDGSMAGVYFKRAADQANARNWMISLQGGGECVDRASCTARLNTSIGSSTSWSAKSGLWGLQRQDTRVNPDFASWNQLLVPYCSGDLFMGQDLASNARAWGMQFSGFHIVHAAIALALDDLGLDAAANVIYSGESAGGLGAVATADFVRHLILSRTSGTNSGTSSGSGGKSRSDSDDNNDMDDVIPIISTASSSTSGSNSNSTVKFALVPVGGAYFDMSRVYAPQQASDPKPVTFIPWGFDSLRKYYTLWNATVPEKCAQATPEAPWECMFFVRSYGTLESDVFVIEAQTDAVVMPLHGGLPPLWGRSSGADQRCNLTTATCPEGVLDYMQWWSQGIRAAVQPLLAQTKSNRDGIFFPACLIHTSFFLRDKPRIRDTGVYAALGEWFFGRGRGGSAAPATEPVFYVDECEPGLYTGVFCGDCPAP